MNILCSKHARVLKTCTDIRKTVREKSIDENKRAMGFINLGPVEMESHSGSQPMDIVWRLKNPLPSFLWSEAAKLSELYL